MAPHPGIVLEVGGPVSAPVGVAPEPDRHRGHGPGHHQLALLPHRARAALGVERLHRRPQVAARNLAREHRHQRATAHEGGAHVGSPADRRQQQVVGDARIHPSEALGRQRGAGGAHAPQRPQVGDGPWHHTSLPAAHQERRAHPEVRRPRHLGQPPQRRQVGISRIAIEQHDGRSDQQARHQQVPHHPARRGEPEEPVARPKVGVQRQRLEVLEQDAAVAMDDRLGQAGRPRRVQNVQRVLEGHRRECEGRGLGHQPLPRDRPRQGGAAVQVGHDDRRR